MLQPQIVSHCTNLSLDTSSGNQGNISDTSDAQTLKNKSCLSPLNSLKLTHSCGDPPSSIFYINTGLGVTAEVTTCLFPEKRPVASCRCQALCCVTAQGHLEHGQDCWDSCPNLQDTVTKSCLHSTATLLLQVALSSVTVGSSSKERKRNGVEHL